MLTKSGGITRRRFSARVSSVLALLAASGCLLPTAPSVRTSNTTSTATSATQSLIPAAGPRAVKIILTQSGTGSFDPPPASGTVNAPGSGLGAMRVFNPDGSLLASGGATASGWPAWLPRFEIGVTGTASGTNPDCARFAGAAENTNCTYAGSAVTFGCGSSPGLFRVSEFDCVSASPPVAGAGLSTDQVYLRAYFSRNPTNLNTGENIMAVVEYAASGFNPAAASPTTCFQGGVFNPEACSDFTWRLYLKHTDAESTIAPFLLFVPPNGGYVNALAQTAGSGVATRQIFLPMAADTALTVFQLTRTKSNLTNAGAFGTTCGGTTPGNSPLCAGMIFYSITFYRI